MRLLVRGFLDEEYTHLNLERIEEVIYQVELEAIRRPEIELIDDDIGVKIHLGLSFSNNGLAGWLIYPKPHPKPHPKPPSYLVCRDEDTSEFVKELMYCGAPEDIINTALLHKTEVLEILDYFFREEKYPQNYVLRPFREVFASLY
ncbi:MAG: hypothetical protein AAGG51_12035 [Cyanobacteria bacterium P01_G01_bin.54]